MSKASGGPETAEDFPVEEEEVATHQEAVPVPYLAGIRRIAARWLDDGLDMKVRQTRDGYSKK
jgi:hypothetical protein